MKIFGTALDKMQSDSCHLSDAVHIWYSLMKDPELSSYYEPIKKRFEDAVQPFHILAYMTDHHFSEDWKNSVDSDHENSAEEWLEQDTEFIGLLSKYKLRDREVFPKQMFSEALNEMSPSEWWKIMKDKSSRSSQNPATVNFCSFLASLHSCPTS
jgi:hypothetical protein